MHEDFSQKKLESSTLSPIDSGTNFALFQYSKAMGALRRSLSSGKQEPLTALMSCILFVCFDSLRGWFESAMVHLQSGLRILRDMRERSGKDDHIIEDNIAPLFMRLSLQSIIYVDTRSTPDRRAFARELMGVSSREIIIPEQYETLEEARNGLNQAADGLFRMFLPFVFSISLFLSHNFPGAAKENTSIPLLLILSARATFSRSYADSRKPAVCDYDLPIGFQPTEAFTLLDKYNAQLYFWNLAFEKFMMAKSREFSSKQVRGAALLKIHHTTAKIMASITPAMNDLSAMSEAVNTTERYMEYVDNFQIIINLSGSLIATAEQDANYGKPSLTFSADLGVIGPLYYTCIKCPIFSLRKAAIDLISRCPRREGMWNSISITKMVEEYWAMEARHRMAQETGEDVDEFGFPVPLGETVNLIFMDGMRWEWKWKDPSLRRSRSSSPASVWTGRPSRSVALW